jgi:hypothetical protein
MVREEASGQGPVLEKLMTFVQNKGTDPRGPAVLRR